MPLGSPPPPASQQPPGDNTPPPATPVGELQQLYGTGETTAQWVGPASLPNGFLANYRLPGDIPITRVVIDNFKSDWLLIGLDHPPSVNADGAFVDVDFIVPAFTTLDEQTRPFTTIYILAYAGDLYSGDTVANVGIYAGTFALGRHGLRVNNTVLSPT